MNAFGARKRIVMVTYGSLGDVQPFLAIGRALGERGHDVVVATSEFYRHQVSVAGLGFAPVRPDRRPCQQDPDFLDRLVRGRESPSDIFRQMFLPALHESVEDIFAATEDADALVTHPLATGARLVAEKRGLPWVSAVMQPMGYLSAHEPPIVGPGWVAAAMRALGPRATGAVHRSARAITAVWLQEWQSVRRELGLNPSPEHPLWDGQHSPTRSLGMFPRLLGTAQPDWPPQARITGFPFYRAPGNELDAALSDFLEAGDPPVVFTLGTTAVNDPGSFYEESAAAIDRLGLRAVLVVRQGSQDMVQFWSRDVVTVPHAPHFHLFPKALAIVHQGGIGTLSEAMLAAKPMLIMPYGHDQADNAWRARRLGIARVLARRSYREGTVARALDRLLRDAATTSAVAGVGRELARERGDVVAAERIAQAINRKECTYTLA